MNHFLQSKLECVQEVVAEEMFVQDNTFLSTFDPQLSRTIPSSSVRLHIVVSYLSGDSTYENIHPCAHTANVQASQEDNPTHGDVL